MKGYDFHPKALEDLEEIWEYISHDSLDAADKVISDILARIDSAVSMPYQGHWRRDLTSRPLRFLSVHQYLIAYAPDQRPIWIVAVMHGHRNPRVMASILRGRQ